MKRFLTLLILIFTLCASASAQTDLYKKCEKEKSITSVYISKAMLQLVGDGKMGPIDNGAMVMLKDKIDDMLILTADNAKGVKFLTDLRSEFMDNKQREILMQINDPNSDMVMVRIPLRDGKSQYALSVLGKNNANMIIIEGILTLEDIARVTNGMGGMKINRK